MSEQPSTAPLAPEPHRIVLTKSQVARIHSRRMQYLFLYIVYFVLFALNFLGAIEHPQVRILLGIVQILSLVLFYVRLWQVVSTMGYPVVMRLGLCAGTLIAIPGLLVVAYFDRLIAKALRSGEDDAARRAGTQTPLA